MSLAAYIWAANLPLSRCNGTPFRVLLLLADRADELGYGAYPHVAKIAETLECSDRTVQRAIRELVNAELLRVGDQRYVEHLDPRYRPTVYDVLTAALVYTESRGDNPVTPDASRGDRSGHPGVTTVVAQRTALRTSYQDSPRHLTLVTAREGESSEPVLVEMSGHSGPSLGPSEPSPVLIEGREDRAPDHEVEHHQAEHGAHEGQQKREPDHVVVHGAQRTGAAS